MSAIKPFKTLKSVVWWLEADVGRFILESVFIDRRAFDLPPKKKSGCYLGFGNFL